MNGYIILGVFILLASLLQVSIDEATGVKVTGTRLGIVISYTARTFTGIGVAVIWYLSFYHGN